MPAYLVSGLYERGTLYDQARPSIAERKPQAHHRAERKGTKAGVCVTYKPDGDGNLRECGSEHRAKRVRFDECGFVVKA